MIGATRVDFNGDVTKLVTAIKGEVMRGIEVGWLPSSVRSFSELHDYCDANMLGDEEWTDTDIDDPERWDYVVDVINASQGLVDSWLKAGRPVDLRTREVK